MSHDPDLHPRVYPTWDGERSTAGSNYGDWRPAQPHERELDAQDPQWREVRGPHFVDEDFDRWRMAFAAYCRSVDRP